MNVLPGDIQACERVINTLRPLIRPLSVGIPQTIGIRTAYLNTQPVRKVIRVFVEELALGLGVC